MKKSNLILGLVLIVGAFWNTKANAACSQNKMRNEISKYMTSKQSAKSVTIVSLEFIKTPGEAVVSYGRADLDATCTATLMLDTHTCSVIGFTPGICVK